MTKIIQFNKEQETCECPVCEIVNEYVQVAQQLENEDQLFELLSDLFSEGMKQGITDYLEQELNHKARLLDELTYGCEECCDFEDDEY